MYADITQQIIKKIEDGCPPWLRPYNKFGGGLPLRHNGIPYRGMNIIMLWMCDFDNPYWMTYPQAQQLGGQVRKGEKSPTKVFHFGTAKDKNKEDRFYSYAKAYSVFNASQITGLPSHYYPKQELYINADKPVASIDKQLANIPAKIVEVDGCTPCYRPATDEVNMPPWSDFVDGLAFYSTKIHELVHWTGHESRLDRLGLKNKKGYAFEELVAEMGASFMMAQLGLEPTARDDHAQYISSWLQALNNDVKYVFEAAKVAQQAVELLNSHTAEDVAIA